MRALRNLLSEYPDAAEHGREPTIDRLNIYLGAPEPDTGHETWIVELDGCIAGAIVEHREWEEYRWGPRRWIAVENPELKDFAARWTSLPMRSLSEALRAFSAHVDDTEAPRASD
jgi:hypothetical protein